MAKKALGRGMEALFGVRHKKEQEPGQKQSEDPKAEEKNLNDNAEEISAEKAKKENISLGGNKTENFHYEEKTAEISAVSEEKKYEIPEKTVLPAEMPKNEIISVSESVSASKNTVNAEVRKLPLDRIRPNMYQPRRNFDESALQELAESIRESGLLQPITVWKDPDREYYEIIAGERRMRACKMAGLKEIDAIVKENLSDDKKLELALIENIQREDLNAIDTAMAYRQLIDHFGISQAEISRTVGKSRAAISNTLRLMELEENIRSAVRSGLISEGHARALLSIPDRQKRQEIFQRIISERMSVREAEAIAQNYHYELPADAVPNVEKRFLPKSPEIIDIQSVLSRHFGSKVEIKPGANGKKGKIVISYYSLDDFERITSILQK